MLFPGLGPPWLQLLLPVSLIRGHSDQGVLLSLDEAELERRQAEAWRRCKFRCRFRCRFSLQRVSKQGDRYLRGLFTAGALAVIRYAKIHRTGHRPWLTALLVRRPIKVAALALANKIARMAWAMMARGERYREPVALAA